MVRTDSIQSARPAGRRFVDTFMEGPGQASVVLRGDIDALTGPADGAELSAAARGRTVPDSKAQARTARRERPGGRGARAALPILIVDNHELVAWSLVYSLRSEGLNARFHPVRSTLAGVLESAGQVRAGIVLLDLDLGRDEAGKPIDGVALVAPLRAAGWRVLILTGGADRSRLGAALAVGGFGWVPKTSPFPALLQALREAVAGRSTTAPSRRRELIELHERCEREHDRIASRMDTLSVREREVLALLADGYRAQAIADVSMVSLATVRTQVRAVLVKLDLRSQLEAVAYYRRSQRY